MSNAPFYSVGHLPPWPAFGRRFIRRAFVVAEIIKSARLSLTWWQPPERAGGWYRLRELRTTLMPDRTASEATRARLHASRCFMSVCRKRARRTGAE